MTASLPSAKSADRLVRGDLGAVPIVAGHTLARAALVGTGIAIAGAGRKDTVRYAIAGAIAIEVFVLLYQSVVMYQETRDR